MRTPPRRWALVATTAIALAALDSATLSLSAWAAASRPGHGKGGAGVHKGKAGKARHHASHQAHGRAPQKKHGSDERHVAAIKGGLPNIQALGALVVDENGHELFSRNPDKERPIASISKLAATLVVMDKGLELEGLSTIAKGDLDAARGGAKSRLLEGMTLSNRDLLHAALMGSDNRAIPALGRAVKLTPTQLAAAMSAKAKALGLKNTRFHDPTGLSTENVSTPRETVAMLKAVMRHPVLGPITHRLEYDAHPVGKPPITYHNTYKPAVRNNIQVLGGKTGYNDDARYCLVIATKIDGHTYFMSFLSNEGKLTRFGDVARVADWVIVRKPQPPKLAAGPGSAPAAGTTATAGALATAPGAEAPATWEATPAPWAATPGTPAPATDGVTTAPATAAPAKAAAAPATAAALPAPTPKAPAKAPAAAKTTTLVSASAQAPRVRAPVATHLAGTKAKPASPSAPAAGDGATSASTGAPTATTSPASAENTAGQGGSAGAPAAPTADKSVPAKTGSETPPASPPPPASSPAATAPPPLEARNPAEPGTH